MMACKTVGPIVGALPRTLAVLGDDGQHGGHIRGTERIILTLN
jgi:hypothetical protein